MKLLKKQAKKSYRRGETLVELLMSILILSLSAVLLASMYFAAAAVNRSARERDQALYDAVTEAETHQGEAKKGAVRYEIEGEATGSGEIQVNIYEGDSVTSYSKEGE